MMSTIRYNPAIQKNNSGESGKMNIPAMQLQYGEAVKSKADI